MASEGGTEDAKRRGDAFARAFSAHLARSSFIIQQTDHKILNRKFKKFLIFFMCFCVD